MRLIKLKVTNFRCFKEETAADLDDITVFIGKNGSGKSSLFDAMDIFIDEKKVPEADDCCVHTKDNTIRIACVFDSLPKQLVIDEQHPTDLASEYLLNPDGNLEVAKVYTCPGKGKGKLKGIFARANHPTAENYSELLSLTNAKLKQRANQLDVDLSNVNQTINTSIRRAIWSHAPDLQCQVADIELKSETAEKIWEQLKKHLPVFALFKSDRPSTDQDEEAQDPMKSAIKEALKGQEATLNDIAEKVKKEVQEIANRTVEKIREMNPELAKQLTPRVANKNWDSLFSVTLTGDKDGQTVIHDGHADETVSEITNSLGVLPDHNIKVFFGVEGRNDIAFFTVISRILRDAGEDVPDLGKAEDEGHLVFVPLGGNNLDLWVSRLKGFNRPEFYLMDRDTLPPVKPKYHAIAEELGRRANCTVWTTERKELENYIHPDPIKAQYPKYAGAGVEFEDVPTLFAQVVHEASSSDQTWADVLSDPEKLGKKVSKAKKRLNSEFVKLMTPDLLTKVDSKDDVRTWLKAIGAALKG
jgi:energy-coupling factor transporter ATP-binding protein EcfA2